MEKEIPFGPRNRTIRRPSGGSGPGNSGTKEIEMVLLCIFESNNTKSRELYLFTASNLSMTPTEDLPELCWLDQSIVDFGDVVLPKKYGLIGGDPFLDGPLSQHNCRDFIVIE